MVCVAPPVTFKPVEFDRRATGDLWEIDGMTGERIAYYRKEIAAGNFVVLGLSVRGQRRATLIYSVQSEPMGARCLVVHEMGGASMADVSLASAAETACEHIASQVGANKLRIWTKRKGLLRVLRDGFELTYVAERKIG